MIAKISPNINAAGITASVGFGLSKDPDTGLIELARNEADRQQSLTIMSVFSNRLADNRTELPEGTDDRRGYWGNRLMPIVGGTPFILGSKLWTLGRSKSLESVAAMARQFVANSLEWKITANEIVTVEVIAQRNNERLELEIIETTPTGTFEQSYNFDWRR